MNVDTMADIEADPEPLPDSIADIADEHGVTEAQLRQALRESHPDASAAEVILAAREVAERRTGTCPPVPSRAHDPSVADPYAARA